MREQKKKPKQERTIETPRGDIDSVTLDFRYANNINNDSVFKLTCNENCARVINCQKSPEKCAVVNATPMIARKTLRMNQDFTVGYDYGSGFSNPRADILVEFDSTTRKINLTLRKNINLNQAQINKIILGIKTEFHRGADKNFLHEIDAAISNRAQFNSREQKSKRR
ncbi:hypothetical protein FACS189421_03140 [Bacteroidia bacterium]|nr:hypothetical protein FACS189421_03140 [Bacteroidia bacterium]